MAMVILQISPTVSSIDLRRESDRIGEGKPIRAPHHTCSTLGALGELALASGGVLFLGEIIEWRKSTLLSLIACWRAMHEMTRPDLVIHVSNVTPDDPFVVQRLANIAGLLPPITDNVFRMATKNKIA
jgi:hypothetical protein